MRRLLLAALLALASLSLAVLAPVDGAIAEASESGAQTPRALLDQWDSSAAVAQEAMSSDTLDFERISELRTRLQTEAAEMSKLAAELETQLAPFRSQLSALGKEPAEGESELPDVARERARLKATIEELEGLSRRTDQAIVRANGLANQLLSVRRQIFAEALLNRGPSVVEPDVLAAGFASMANTTAAVLSETSGRVTEKGFSLTLLVRVLSPLLIASALLLALRRVRRVIVKRLMRQIDAAMPASRRVAVAAGLTAARLVLPILAIVVALAAAAASDLLGKMGMDFLTGLAIASVLVIGAYALGGAFFAPRSPELRISALGDADARQAHRRLVFLAGVVGLDRMLVARSDAFGLSVEALTILNFSLLALGGFALWQFVATIKRGAASDAAERDAAEGDEGGSSDTEASEPVLVPLLLRISGVVLRAAALLAPILALGGFYAASRYVFYPPVASAALIGFFVLLASIVGEVVEAVMPSDAASATGRRLRLIPVTVGFLLTSIAVPLLALIWGATTVDLAEVWRHITEGFTIGELKISPSEFISFLVAFAIGLGLTRLLQGILRRSVLPLTSLDAGGRAAVIAGVGYVGVFATSLVAISMAGLDLSNLAILAGALSVGIGFGLQNIVNNFVSGIILLVERPIKAGDWVQIPSGMGYVKQINVRSTEIETFDRSSLIVPNSELISGTVTNYTHDNLQGRMIVPVGVAYGTDTRKVEQILLEISRAHPMVLRRPAPWINFAGFGDSSLNFEIRAILRDVNWVMNTKSDINHEIARRFAEEGIEIPFPQRDLHIRTPGAQPSPVEEAAAPSKRRRRASVRDDEPDDMSGDAEADGDGGGDGR